MESSSEYTGDSSEESNQLQTSLNPDNLRIMIASDCHLGYLGNDEERGTDSFAAFEEVLLAAKQKKVDFVLLAGDLFHESKPSTSCLNKCMLILRKYCMGNEPIHVQIVGDQASCFPKDFCWSNFYDSNYNVGLAVYSIHGNHDKPSEHFIQPNQNGGSGACSLNLLHTAGLVNYFGFTSEVDDVLINPILLQKGQTKLALYGLGNMKDDRLTRMWAQGRVKFNHVSENFDSEDETSESEWFNLFVLHQNRVKRVAKNYLKEEMIPSWIDLVVWGHEHESKAQVEESLKGSFMIVQPGSTVATSLVPGEAAPKHCAILSIDKSLFKIDHIRLKQVRPFVIKEIDLAEVHELNPRDKKIEEKMIKYLVRKVKEMIENDRASSREEDAAHCEQQHQMFNLVRPEKYLARLVVYHGQFPAISNQSFATNFASLASNPKDILLFKRRKTQMHKIASAKSKLSTPIRPDSIEELSIGCLIKDNLSRNGSLKMFSENRMSVAIEQFVKKESISSIVDAVKWNREKLKSHLFEQKGACNEAIILEELAKFSEKMRGEDLHGQIQNIQGSIALMELKPGSVGGENDQKKEIEKLMNIMEGLKKKKKTKVVRNHNEPATSALGLLGLDDEQSLVNSKRSRGRGSTQPKRKKTLVTDESLLSLGFTPIGSNEGGKDGGGGLQGKRSKRKAINFSKLSDEESDFEEVED